MSEGGSGATRSGKGSRGASGNGAGTTTDDGTKSPAAGPDRRRRTAILAALGAVVVAALVVLLITQSGSGSPSRSAAAGSSVRSAAATDTSVPPPLPTPTPTGPTGNATELPSALPPVPFTASASESNGVVASIAKIESIQGSANGPGNVAGPAVRVTVRLQNGTSQAISLGGVAVNMYYGANNQPASPLDDPSQHPFGGMLAAGKSADGVYVFTVPKDSRGAVTVEVGYQAGAPLLLFTGSVR